MSNTVFAAKRDGDDLVLDVFSVVGRSWDGEGVTAKAVAKALADAPKAKRIVMRINSPGGDVFEGNTIVSLLRESGKTIRTEVHGLAASMGSILALAGDEVVMAEGAMMMIHNPWGFAVGDSNSMRKRADLLDKLRGGLLDTYAKRANISREKISDMMDAETWMTATEAIKNGFADGVMAGADAEALACYRYMEKDDASAVVAAHHKAVPHQAAATVAPLEAEGQKMPEDTKVDKPDADAAAATDIPMVPRADLELRDATIAALQAELAEVKAGIEADRKAAHDVKAEAAIAAALQAGKIAPASAAYHRGCCATAEGLAAFLAFCDAAPSIVAPAPIAAEPKAEDKKPRELTDNQRALCAKFNLTEDDFRAAMGDGE